MKITFVILVLWVLFAQGCMKFRIDDTTAIDDFKKEGIKLNVNTAKINGTNLHYVFCGADSLPTLVFIHGSPGSWTAFENYLKDTDLLKHFRIVSIDRPGFGYSDFGKAKHMDKQAAIISVLLHQLKGNKPMYLVGHSLGGPMIVELAYDNPGLINALVILAGSVDPAAEKKEGWRPILSYSPLRYLIPGALRPSNDELMYFKEDVLQMPEMLSQIKCRVYILQGDHDSLVPYENSLYAKSKMVNAKSMELITLPNEDHFIPWTNFNDIKNVLLRLNE